MLRSLNTFVSSLLSRLILIEHRLAYALACAIVGGAFAFGLFTVIMMVKVAIHVW